MSAFLHSEQASMLVTNQLPGMLVKDALNLSYNIMIFGLNLRQIEYLEGGKDLEGQKVLLYVE